MTNLEEAVHQFNIERNEHCFLKVLTILRDSHVWIPCNAILSEADRKRFEDYVAKAEKNSESLIGLEFTAQDETRLVPDILKNGENYYFPVFSSKEAMGEYGEHFSKVEKFIMEVITLAKNNDKSVAGIVLNAFTEPFVLEKDLWEVFDKMKTQVK